MTRLPPSGATTPAGSPDERPVPIPLVSTRLDPPPLPSTYVPRERIAALLSRGGEESCRLTLVSAPPGYGKTMAVRGWLAGEPRASAWLSLDAGDDDPARLARYLIGALDRARPGFGRRTAALLGFAGVPSLDALVATILDELSESDTSLVLVLDDCHLLASGAGHDLVARLVTHAPPYAQIVLVTRRDPDLPLARLRAHAALVEVRADDLRHTAPEAGALLARLGVHLDAASVERLTERTEGWAAGLQLAALTLRGRPDADAVVAGLDLPHRYVIDYLADEVLAHLPDDMRRFLERTSVVERLCAGLADALTGTSTGERTLREVEERNLFLQPLGTDGRWYRYHHLFADYLRTRLDDAERRDLMFRAATWCAGQGLAAEAATYALESRRWDEVTPIVSAGCRASLELGEPGAVLRWCAAMPEGTIAASPGLLADRAWAAYLTGDSAVLSATAAELAAADAAGRLPRGVAGRAHGARAWHAVLAGDAAEGERLARRALEDLDLDSFHRGMALLALSDACWDLGRADENAAAVAEALQLARDRGPSLATYLTGYIYAIGCAEQGRRPEGERACREMLADAVDDTGRTSPAAGPLRVGLGILVYEANDLRTASAELEAGFASCRRLGIDALLGGESRRARAMTRLAVAGGDAARDAADEGMRAARRVLPGTRMPAAEGVSALVAVRTGDVRTALAWAERALGDPARTRTKAPNVRLYRDLTIVRILLASGAAARAEALALEAGRYAAWAGTVLGQVQASILAASAAERQGRRADARSRLGDAVTMAAPGGYVRRFVEDGPPLAHLLPSVRLGAGEFVDRVTDALAAEAARIAPGRTAAGAAWVADDGALVELLTERELDVLRLLARGGSNAAIGRALGVSAGTVKWHVANVLGKLGASSRTQAAARARDLGLV